MVKSKYEKSLNHSAAFRQKLTFVHPQLKQKINSNYSIYMSSPASPWPLKRGKWPLPAEQYLYFCCETKSIRYQFVQVLCHKTEGQFLVANKSGYLKSYQNIVEIETFDCCRTALKQFHSILHGIKDIAYGLFEKHDTVLIYNDPHGSMKPHYKNILKRKKEIVDSYAGSNKRQLVIRFFEALVSDYTFNLKNYMMSDELFRQFGWPNHHAFIKALKCLSTIQEILESRALKRKANNEVVAVDNQELWHHSALFNILIPNFKGENLLISSKTQVLDKLFLLKAIRNKLLARAQASSELAIAWMADLKHPLVMMGEREKFYSDIKASLTFTPSARVELACIFKYNQVNDLSYPATNKMLLWHGTHYSNVYSILKQGFSNKKAKEKSHFGKGFYFSDHPRRSVGFCRQDPSDKNFNNLVLLLCEVKLGRRKLNPSPQDDFEAFKQNYDSMVVLRFVPFKSSCPSITDVSEDGGKFLPKKVVQDCNLVDLHVEPCILKDKKGAYLCYRDYIVWDPKNIKVRYVVNGQFF